MKRFLKAARRVALVSVTVLLIGESGVGKSVFARQIHLWSRRREQPLISLNCATLSEVRSAGAELDSTSRILLKLRRCATNGEVGAGTIFLDNLADLDRGGQTALLDFIESQRLQSPFATDPPAIGPRIIAATSRELANEVTSNNFRADLFYRISAVSLRIPPLRERPEDILPLAEHLLRIESNAASRPGLRFSDGAAFALRHHQWPGNVWELRNTIERAVILGQGDELTADELPDVLPWHPSALGQSNMAEPITRLRDLEKNHIVRVLANSANFEQAAHALGIDSTTLHRKRRLYNLD
jgi:two-component system, NtrC family, response regulator AlgB